MNATFVQNGDIIDHIPTADLALGAVVVLGALVGISHRPITAGALGSLALGGVWELPAAPGVAAPAGTPVFWNTATAQATTDAAVPGVIRCGVLARARSAADDRVRVLLNR